MAGTGWEEQKSLSCRPELSLNLEVQLPDQEEGPLEAWLAVKGKE